MTVIPLKDTTIAARTDADMAQEFQRWVDEARTVAFDITGWSFTFVVKSAASDAAALLSATSGAGVSIIDAASGRLLVSFSKETLAAAMPATAAKRFDGVYALQAAGPGGSDEVWAAGDFALIRGL